jgi:hypothetical protein
MKITTTKNTFTVTNAYGRTMAKCSTMKDAKIVANDLTRIDKILKAKKCSYMHLFNDHLDKMEEMGIRYEI